MAAITSCFEDCRSHKQQSAVYFVQQMGRYHAQLTAVHSEDQY